MPFSRRSFLSVTGLSTLGISAAVTRAWGQPAAPPAVAAADVFPGAGSRNLVREVVGASHGNFARVREIVEKQPASPAHRRIGDSATGKRASMPPRMSATSRSPTSC